MSKISSPLSNLALFSVLAFSQSQLVVASSASLDTVVVTATRTATTVNESVSSVRVIDRQQIEKSHARSLPELLSGVAGLHFATNGGRGSNSSLFMRGTNSDHLIVLIDGVKVGSATSGTVAFQHISIDQIERIEIVRGPRSSLYGSEAIGGVIQVFTKRGGGETRQTMSATAGSNDTFEGSLGVSGGGENFFYNLGLSGTTTSGIDGCRARPVGAPFGGCYADQPDDDGYESFSESIRLGYRTDSGSDISVNATQSNNKTEFDGGSQNNNETVQRVLGLSTNLVLSDEWFLKVAAGRSRDKSDNYKDLTYASTFDTTRDSVSLQSDLVLFDDDTLTFGGDYLRDEVDSSTAYAVTERENTGGFAQYLMQAGAHSVELSVRHDDNDQFGSHVTHGVGYGVDLSEGLRFVSAYGTAFKAPSFNELYYPGFSNSELDPEDSKTFEAGLRGVGRTGTWALTMFRTEIDDLIVLDATYTPDNLDKAAIKGVELEVAQDLTDQWSMGLDLSLISPVNRSVGANEGNTLARRPTRSGQLDLGYDAGRWSAGASLNFVGTRWDDIANTKKLKAYRTLDLKAELELAEAWTLQARVENVSDTAYETAYLYNQSERNLSFTLRYAP